MINAKIMYNTLLESESLSELVDSDSIFDSYPSTIEVFPCICFLDAKQKDIEYADNQHQFENCSVEIHIFTKALEDYPTTSEIGIEIAKVFNADLWTMTESKEVPDVDDDVRHRVMEFNKGVFVSC